jgi:hypothetical protein
MIIPVVWAANTVRDLQYAMDYGQHVCLILSHVSFIYGAIVRTKSTEQTHIPKKS